MFYLYSWCSSTLTIYLLQYAINKFAMSLNSHEIQMGSYCTIYTISITNIMLFQPLTVLNVVGYHHQHGKASHFGSTYIIRKWWKGNEKWYMATSGIPRSYDVFGIRRDDWPSFDNLPVVRKVGASSCMITSILANIHRSNNTTYNPVNITELLTPSRKPIFLQSITWSYLQQTLVGLL